MQIVCNVENDFTGRFLHMVNSILDFIIHLFASGELCIEHEIFGYHFVCAEENAYS